MHLWSLRTSSLERQVWHAVCLRSVKEKTKRHCLYYFCLYYLIYCLAPGPKGKLIDVSAVGWTASIRPTWRGGWSQASAPQSLSSSPSTTSWRWNRPWCWWRAGAPPSCPRSCPCGKYQSKPSREQSSWLVPGRTGKVPIKSIVCFFSYCLGKPLKK